MSIDSIHSMLEFLLSHRHTDITYTFSRNEQAVASVRLRGIGIIEVVIHHCSDEVHQYLDVREAALVIDQLIN